MHIWPGQRLSELPVNRPDQAANGLARWSHDEHLAEEIRPQMASSAEAKPGEKLVKVITFFMLDRICALAKAA
jgi:hypothetical protein